MVLISRRAAVAAKVEITSSQCAREIECPLGAIVGTITLRRGEGQLATALGRRVGVCQVGRTDHTWRHPHPRRWGAVPGLTSTRPAADIIVDEVIDEAGERPRPPLRRFRAVIDNNAGRSVAAGPRGRLPSRSATNG